MKSPLRTLLCRGPFARRMSSPVAARPTSGLALATMCRRPGPSLLASSLMAVPTVATGPAVTSSPVASPAAASSATDRVAMACSVVASTAAANPVTDSLVNDTAQDSPEVGGPVADSPGAATPETAPALDLQSAGTLPGASASPEIPASPQAPAAGPAPHPARSGWSRWPGRSFRPARRAGPGGSARAVNLDLAAEFIQLHRREVPGAGPAGPRLREIRREIRLTGTYRHTLEELEFGARVAWRNSSRCIGRLYWKSLKVRDRREMGSAADIAAECADHLRAATNHGRVRPLITVFAPDTPARSGPRIWNEQLVRYAGYQQPDGSVRGEPGSAELTNLARALGWATDGRGRFDVLPLIISTPDERPQVFDVPAGAVTEVHLIHPRFPWFGELGLRWYAVPVISDMCLEIGGICYPAAPFNGWYMGTEIGARNLADSGRYNQLPEIAARMGLDTARERSLWRDQALVELNLAVLHSFETAGVTITDHHTESRRFLTHLTREERAGRVCPADWTWIVPPISGAATEVFHRYYSDTALRPAYARHQRTLPPAPAPRGETCS
jgi:nitric-oxide synthase, bacterial